ncbi:MAG: hypothetical protein AAF492_09940, partial [Verrucomicrobiota bacterium]
PGVALGDLIASQGWDRMPCALGLSGLSTIFRTSAGPTDKPADGKNETVLGSARMRIDGRPRFLEAETHRDTAAQQCAWPRELNLKVIDLIPNNLAVYNATALSLSDDEPFLCADISEHGTDLAIGTRGGIFFIRSFTSETLTLKESFSTSSSGLKWIESWIEQLNLFLDRYRNQEPGLPEPRQILLTGDGAEWFNFATRVTEATGIETRTWDCMALHPEGSCCEFATAFGLAVTGMKKSPVYLSLMPPLDRQTIALRWQVNYWLMGCAAAILTVLVAGWIALLSLDRVDRNLETTRRELLHQLRLERRLAKLEEENRTTARNIEALRKTVENGLNIRSVLGAVAEAKHPDDWITLVADEASYFGPPESEAEAGLDPQTLGFEKVIVEGYTPVEDLSITREMIGALKEHPAVADADLLADDRVRANPERDDLWTNTGCRLFAVEITLVEEAGE